MSADADMVVDPALHVLGWSPERAKEYLLSIGFSPARAEAAIERMSAEPAWLPIYSYGAEQIAQLRENAQRELGARFDIREFHARVLEDGPLPVWALREKIEHWVAARR